MSLIFADRPTAPSVRLAQSTRRRAGAGARLNPACARASDERNEICNLR